MSDGKLLTVGGKLAEQPSGGSSGGGTDTWAELCNITLAEDAAAIQQQIPLCKELLVKFGVERDSSSQIHAEYINGTTAYRVIECAYSSGAQSGVARIVNCKIDDSYSCASLAERYQSFSGGNIANEQNSISSTSYTLGVPEAALQTFRLRVNVGTMKAGTNLVIWGIKT